MIVRVEGAAGDVELGRLAEERGAQLGVPADVVAPAHLILEESRQQQALGRPPSPCEGCPVALPRRPRSGRRHRPAWPGSSARPFGTWTPARSAPERWRCRATLPRRRSIPRHRAGRVRRIPRLPFADRKELAGGVFVISPRFLFFPTIACRHEALEAVHSVRSAWAERRWRPVELEWNWPPRRPTRATSAATNARPSVASRPKRNDLAVAVKYRAGSPQ